MTTQHDTGDQDQPTESTKTYHASHDRHNTSKHDRDHPISATFDQEDNDILNEHPTFMDDQQEYMRWHYKLNHASQRVMTKMAYKGMLPKPITKILRPWINKVEKAQCVMIATVLQQLEHPGEPNLIIVRGRNLTIEENSHQETS
jgi:hypothetical protein